MNAAATAETREVPPRLDRPLWLGRIGGAILHPRRTLEATLSNPGRTADAVFVLGVLAGLLATPVRTAKAVAMTKISFLTALQGLVGVLGTTVLWEILAIIVVAPVLHWLASRRGHAPSSEAVLAAAALTLVPFFALVLVGALLDQLGLDQGRLLNLLPNRPWRLYARGAGGDLALRLLVAYGWTGMMLSWLAVRLLRRKETSK